MAMMTGGEALAKSLYRHGVRVVFGVPGVQLYHAMDALYGEPGIRFVTTRHEQGAAYMAYGYSRAGGEGVGTALVVPGPGLQNASAGVGTAYAASCPMLLVSGQIGRDHIGQDRGELHEINDQLDTIRPVTKWASRVLRAADVPGAVHEAFEQIGAGRPRPVEIELPPEALEETADVELPEPGPSEPIEPDSESVRKAAQALAAAARPLIWAGGGVVSSGASSAVQKVAEHLQAPVVTTGGGKGALSDNHYLCLGVPGWQPDTLDSLIKDADVVLAVGTRVAETGLRESQRVLQIDVDADEVGRNHANTLGVVGDARRSLDELYRVLSASTRPRSSRRSELEEIKRARRADQPEPQADFVNAIRAAMPDDGILVEGVTQIGYACRVHYPVYGPRSYITSSYYGNLGFAYPTALGAKVAQPHKAVAAVSGDGGFLFNSQELATAVQHGINAVVIVFNDNAAFGNVLRDQRERFGGRVIGSELHNPDFVGLAQAYGARGVLAKDAEDLEATLRKALATDAPTLIEVPVGMMPSPW